MSCRTPEPGGYPSKEIVRQLALSVRIGVTYEAGRWTGTEVYRLYEAIRRSAEDCVREESEIDEEE